MIHWDPSQKFHFDLKCVKIPFLASEAHCFGDESWTYFVFWILCYWFTSQDPNMCHHHPQATGSRWHIMKRRAHVFPDISEYTPLLILHHGQCKTSQITLAIFFLQQAWPWPASPSCRHRREGGVGWVTWNHKTWPWLTSWGECCCVGHSLVHSGNSMSLELGRVSFEYRPRHLPVTLSQLFTSSEPSFSHLIIKSISYNCL